jgi:hypothetical protein
MTAESTGNPQGFAPAPGAFPNETLHLHLIPFGIDKTGRHKDFIAMKM